MGHPLPCYDVVKSTSPYADPQSWTSPPLELWKISTSVYKLPILWHSIATRETKTAPAFHNSRIYSTKPLFFCPLDANKNKDAPNCLWEWKWLRCPLIRLQDRWTNQANFMRNVILLDDDRTDYSGPEGPWNSVTEKCECTADNYLGCLSICWHSHIYGFMVTLNHPQKNYLGEVTEKHNRVPVIQQTLSISLIIQLAVTVCYHISRSGQYKWNFTG